MHRLLKREKIQYYIYKKTVTRGFLERLALFYNISQSNLSHVVDVSQSDGCNGFFTSVKERQKKTIATRLSNGIGFENLHKLVVPLLSD